MTSSEECVEKLKAKYETILDDIKEKRNEEREKLLEELKPILLNDEEFAMLSEDAVWLHSKMLITQQASALGMLA